MKRDASKRLIAALAELRGKLALVEALIEEQRDDRALELLDEASESWSIALEELRAA